MLAALAQVVQASPGEARLRVAESGTHVALSVLMSASSEEPVPPPYCELAHSRNCFTFVKPMIRSAPGSADCADFMVQGVAVAVVEARKTYSANGTTVPTLAPGGPAGPCGPIGPGMPCPGGPCAPCKPCAP